MKRMVKTIAVVLLCGLLAAPAIDARGRKNTTGSASTHQSTRTGTTHSRGNNSGTRPGAQRPGNNGTGPDSNSRPSNNRPDSRPENNNKPSNNKPNNQPNKPDVKPDNKPGSGHNPEYRPGGHGPIRPHMPQPRPFHRPVPPPAWHPTPDWVPFHTMLGITIGSTFAYTLSELIQDNYTVNSYNNNTIYLSNVSMLNMNWPDAVLYFNNYDQLYASSYIYTSTGYSMSRYDVAYTSLSSQYGLPVSTQNLSNGIESVWWGSDNQFIRLSYLSEYSNDGRLRYYTTLSYGNYQD